MSCYNFYPFSILPTAEEKFDGDVIIGSEEFTRIPSSAKCAEKQGRFGKISRCRIAEQSNESRSRGQNDDDITSTDEETIDHFTSQRSVENGEKNVFESAFGYAVTE